MDVEQVKLLLNSQQKIIEQIGNAGSPNDILLSICEQFELNTDKSAKTSILLLKGKCLYHGATARLPKQYCETLDGLAIGPNVASCGTAAYLKKRVLVNDLETDPRWSEHKSMAIKHGLRACWSWPILSSNNQVLGTFAVYYPFVKSPLETDFELTRYFISLCALAIEKHLDNQTSVLLQQKIEREQSDNSIRELSGGISHDFSNVLSIVLGYADLLKYNDSNCREVGLYANQIIKACRRGTRLTQKMLSLSHREQQIKSSKQEINTLLLEQQDILQKALMANIELSYELSDDLWSTEIEARGFDDIIFNLSIKAKHAMDNNSAGRRLTITTMNKSINHSAAKAFDLMVGDYVVVYVSDNGCSIEEAQGKSILTPLLSPKEGDGSDPILCQVAHFVKRHGGVVHVDSTPGYGRQFVLYFPRLLVRGKVTAKSTLQESEGSKRAVSILLVDDEESLSQSLFELLKYKGYLVYTACGGKQALEILRQQSIHLMICDVIMPQMDGYQLAEAVKASYPRVKIQLITGFALKHNLAGDEALKQNILYKPFSVGVLLQNIQKQLNPDQYLSRAKY